MAKRTRGNPLPLIIENHPEDYEGYPFITLIQYRDEDYLVIVDNTDKKNIHAYVLDFCGPEKVSEQEIINIAHNWWVSNRNRFPLSFEFSRLNLTGVAGRIYKSFNIEYVKRVIGPMPVFDMSETVSIKRRKKKPVPKGVVVHNHLTMS